MLTRANLFHLSVHSLCGFHLSWRENHTGSFSIKSLQSPVQYWPMLSPNTPDPFRLLEAGAVITLSNRICNVSITLQSCSVIKSQFVGQPGRPIHYGNFEWVFRAMVLDL